MEKRKTYTSSAVKNRYNKKTYTQISVSVKKATAEVYKKRCKELGIPLSKVLHEAIENFLTQI